MTLISNFGAAIVKERGRYRLMCVWFAASFLVLCDSRTVSVGQLTPEKGISGKFLCRKHISLATAKWY